VKLSYAEYEKAKDFTCLGAWCLLCGPENHLKRRALARMREEAIRPGEDISWEVLDGPGISARDLLNRCQTGALFGGSRVLVIQSADRIDADEQDRLAKDVGALPQGVSVILVTAEVADRNGRRRAVRAALRRAIEQHGLAIEFAAMKVPAAAAWAIQQAKERGKKLEPSAARKLAEQRVGTGLAEMESEVEKLSLYVGDASAITTADVDAVTPRLVEEDVWGLMDAVRQRSSGRAVAILRELLTERREDPGRLLGLLAQSVRLIWQTKLLMDHGWRPGQQPNEETAALLPQEGRKNALAQLTRLPWMAKRTMQAATGFSWEQLTRALQALLSCDLAMKGIQGKIADEAFALELLVIQLCSDIDMPVWQSPAGEKRVG
jgi:DNA polymerase-3 subunit delta